MKIALVWARWISLVLGLSFPLVEGTLLKLSILGVVLIFLILDSDHTGRWMRVSVFFVAGAIVGFTYRFIESGTL